MDERAAECRSPGPAAPRTDESASPDRPVVAPRRRVTGWEIAVLFAILFAALAIRLHFFSGIYLSDDMRHAWHAYFMVHPDQQPAADVQYTKQFNYRRMGVNLPLAACIWLLGPEEWVLSIPSLLGSLGTIAVIFAFLRHLANPLAGLIGAALYAVLPVDVYVATVCLQDTIFVCFLGLGLYGLLRAVDAQRFDWLWALSAGLAFAYAQLAKENAFMIVGVIGGWGLWRTWRQRRLDRSSVWTVFGFLVGLHLIGLLFWILERDYAYFFAQNYYSIRWIREHMAERFSHAYVLEALAGFSLNSWVFGYALYAFPLALLLALLDARNRFRLPLLLLLLLQFYVVYYVMKASANQQRYMLQFGLFYVIFLVLGLWHLLRVFGPRTRNALLGVLGTALVIATAAALDHEQQQYSYARGQGLRAAQAYLVDAASDNDIIHCYRHRSMIPTEAGRMARGLFQLNRFQNLKGGFGQLHEALNASQGWVVLAWWHRWPPRIPENWLEVLRAGEPNVVRVFKIYPKPHARYFTVWPPFGGGLPYLEPPQLDPQRLVAIPFNQPESWYFSHWNSPAADTAVTITPEGLHYQIQTPDQDKSHYGGIRLPAPGLHALRLSVSFTHPDDIMMIYVYGHDVRRRRILTWSWNVEPGTKPRCQPETITLVPGQPSGHFRPGDVGDPSAVDTVHVFMRVAGRGHAGFTIHKAEIIPEPASTPDLAGFDLRPIPLDAPAAQYHSAWSFDRERVRLTRTDAGLHCKILADSPEANYYGGLRVPIPSLGAARLRLSFEHPAAIRGVFVDALDGHGRHRLRWQWRATVGRPVPTQPTDFPFVPGEHSGWFHFQGSRTGHEIRFLDVFVAAEPDSESAFTLHELATAPAAPPSPDVSAYEFSSQSFAAPAEAFLSKQWGQSEQRSATLQNETLVAEFSAGPPRKRGYYGGLTFSLDAAAAFRLDVTLVDPDDLETLFVDAHAADGKRVCRWHWRVAPDDPIDSRRESWVFMPGEPVGLFEPIGACTPGPISRVEFFARIRPEGAVRMLVHDLAAAPPPTPATRPALQTKPTTAGTGAPRPQ